MSAVIPRGIRNCNPGNIRLSGTSWLGLAETQLDPDFFQFISPEYGIRAMARILKTYQGEGVTTLRETISRWAPSSENDTAAYVTDVCAQCAVGPDDTIDLVSLLPRLIPAIIQHENGEQPYDPTTITYAISLA